MIARIDALLPLVQEALAEAGLDRRHAGPIVAKIVQGLPDPIEAVLRNHLFVRQTFNKDGEYVVGGIAEAAAALRKVARAPGKPFGPALR